MSFPIARRMFLASAPLVSAARIFDVRSRGAKGDGATLDTEPLNRAIEECSQSGGGTVYVGPGTYLTGTVEIKSNVTLYLEAQATLLGSLDITQYKKAPGTGHSHLVLAIDAENIGIAGPGRIDGQGPKFWVPSGRKVPPPEDAWKDVATYDWKPLKRASPMVEFANCRNVRVTDVRMENAPGWTFRPINCDNVWIQGITIRNPVYGINTDGIDPSGCQNLFISDCLIETGDDAICLKSETGYGHKARLSKNITITNCVLTCCCNGLKFGTATHGGFENVTFTNSVIYNNDVDYRARVISGIAVEMVDGGWIDGVVISNVRMQNVRTPIFIRRGNRTPRADGAPGRLRGVMIDNLHATGAILTNSITGLPGFDVEDVTLSNIRIDSEEAGKAEWASIQVPEKPGSYPEARMFGRLPSYGFYVRHVNGITMRGVELRAAPAERRPAIICDDVQNAAIYGFRTPHASPDQPVIRLRETRTALLSGCMTPGGGSRMLDVSGAGCKDIWLTGNAIRSTSEAVRLTDGASDDALIRDTGA